MSESELPNVVTPDKIMGVTVTTKLILAFRSGNRCAFKNCPQYLTEEGGDSSAIIGEAAHIAGEKPESARYIATMTDEERSDIQNLIYMCPSHHTLIDKLEADYPIKFLQELKKEHERRVNEAMTEGFADVGFKELGHATQWIATAKPSLGGNDYRLLPPEDKMKKNHLTDRVRHTITMGLAIARVVEDFVNMEAKIDASYPDRLRAGFLSKYYEFVRLGYSGDTLFELMCSFSQQGLRSQPEKSAGLAVFVFLFERCEVFER